MLQLKYMENHKYTAIIVDDERLARNALKTLLEEIDEIELTGEADSVSNAISLIAKVKPDIIFLDIQMPGESGFDLIEKISTNIKIIFVTAFDEFALRAFEVNAIDYLLKPVSVIRLKTSIARLFEENSIDETAKKKLVAGDRLFLLFNNNYLFLKIENILHISSSGDYSELHLIDGKKGLTNKSMQEWEARLPINTFCRIHRCTIINMDYVVKVDEWFNNAFRIHMKGIEEPFIMSRRFSSVIRNRFN